MPNLSHFSFITETANGIAAPPAMIGGAFIYALVYDIILLTITVLIFSRRVFWLLRKDYIAGRYCHRGVCRDIFLERFY